MRLSPAPGEPIIAAAWRSGVFWPTQCWGQAQCGTCVLRVVAGGENLSEMSAEERATLTRYGWLRRDVNARLACRATVVGPDPVTVQKGGVRPGTPADELPESE